ncbi:hypothetical protein V1288_002121 [Bradyrhizobium sp. AZCC 2176]
MPQRKRRLPISSSGQPAPKFEPNAVFWGRCETAYGRAISREIREEVVTATNNFLWIASMEAEAEDLNAAVERIGRYRKAAGALLNEQGEPGSTASIFYAEYLIQSEFPDTTLDQLHDLLMSYHGACARAQGRAASENEPEFRQGASWDTWIRNITAICKRHQLPIGSRKDDDKMRQHSPFVRLVYELQSGFDHRYLRGAHSRTAVAKAIGDARRSGRKTAASAPQ